jgi:hypothetical protein
LKFNGLHGFISQKTELFITTAQSTSEYVARMAEKRNAYRIEGKRPLGRTRFGEGTILKWILER